MSIDAPFERLGAQRFERFCQALLSYDYPDLQVVPFGQGDGGRDGWTLDGSRPELVLQVKYVQAPETIRNPVSWLRRTLRGEREKMERLAAKGATAYRLMTNVRGTAAFERGSIDLAQVELADLPIRDAQVLWRDDLLTRLTMHPDLNRSFRELQTADDLLAEQVERGLLDTAHRRGAAMRSFIVAQFEEDQEVRFDQVDMNAPLAAVWVDVPCHGVGLDEAPGLASDEVHHDAERLAGPAVGTAAALLRGRPEAFQRVFVHGAPGQGKSTLSQYVCQVHRTRLLGRTAPEFEKYEDTLLRLPFRVELRHLAAFLRGEGLNGMRIHEPRTWSLEQFLADLVSVRSGGAPFDVSDLQAAIRGRPVLLAFDGLDEIADERRSTDTIDIIHRALPRLDDIAQSMQVVITSRPRALGRSTPAPFARWRVLRLADLPTKLVMRYARASEKVRGRNFERIEDTIDLLTDHLRDPSFAELARNPMQLAIVLSLLQRRGKSLPDHRGELYTAYMEHFMDREGEKSALVLRHRGRLLRLHGHIAFHVHAASEEGSRGVISITELRKLVDEFLADAEEGRELADELFTGVERIMALVSREVGTLEFEVQPVREYFAASHLYDTAPPIRDGATIVDRFDALSRSPFWLNVLRFYAARYGTGQLSSLVDGLEKLSADPQWRLTAHPRQVTTALLLDRVFGHGSAEVAQRATAVALTGLPDRHCLGHGTAMSEPGAVFGEPRSARHVAERCLDLLSEPLLGDRVQSLTELLCAHSDGDVAGSWMRRLQDQRPQAAQQLLVAGLRAGLAMRLDNRDLDALVGDVHTADDALCVALVAGTPEYVEAADDAIVRRCLQAIARRGLPILPFNGLAGSTVAHWAFVLEAASNRSIGLPRTVTGHFGMLPEAPRRPGPTVRRAYDILVEFDRRGGEQRISADALASMVEATRWFLDDTVRMVAATARLVDLDASWTEADSLVDPTLRLTDRLGFARRMARDATSSRWWQRQMDMAEDDVAVATVVMALMRWGHLWLLVAFRRWLSEACDRLADTTYSTVATSVQDSGEEFSERDAGQFAGSTSDSFRTALAGRFTLGAAISLMPVQVDQVAQLRQPVRRQVGNVLLQPSFVEAASHHPGLLDTVERIYALDPAWTPATGDVGLVGSFDERGVVQEILARAASLPLALVQAAEGLVDAPDVPTIADVAWRRQWFDDV